MSPQARREYMKTVRARYGEAKSKRAKGVILDEFCKTYQCHRKHALRVLNRPEQGGAPQRARRGSPYDDPRVLDALAAVWEASGCVWGERLKALLPQWLPSLRKRFALSEEQVALLLRMSGATLDRKLRSKKQVLRRRIYGTTRPGKLFKHHIPIKTDSWDVDRPGHMEVDLVSHSGDAAEGDFGHTLNMTDVFTGWVERRCVLGKGQVGVQQAIDSIRRELPFELLALDSDNGSEFINHHLWSYCRQHPQVQMTRGRPYKKDDNAHVEQKNWTHVRKLLGYGRYETDAALAAINELYRDELRWFQNLFLPSMKLIGKEHVGSKLRRRFDAPRTPLDRVIGSGVAIGERLQGLQRLAKELDPFVLSKAIEGRLEHIWAMRSKAPRPTWYKRGFLPDYENKPLSGPPMMTELPGIERFEQSLRREHDMGTW
jgi:hypothetical protein